MMKTRCTPGEDDVYCDIMKYDLKVGIQSLSVVITSLGFTTRAVRLSGTSDFGTVENELIGRNVAIIIVIAGRKISV